MTYCNVIDTAADSGPDKGPAGYLNIAHKYKFDPMARFKDGVLAEFGNVDDCAKQMIKSTALREVHTYFPTHYGVWWPVMKSQFFPEWMRSIIRNYKIRD